MRRAEAEISARGIDVLVVTFEAPARAAAYVAATGLPWPLLVDAGRELYTAYGMGRARARDLWGPASWLAYARLLWQGQRPGRATGDITQLGGDVLIDPDGIVRLHHVGRGPADRPPLAALLDAAGPRRAS